MGTVFNKKELLVLLQDFHCLTGLRSAVFDSYGIEVLAYPPELPAYCRLIRSVPDGKTGCYLCDQAACRKATRQKQTIIYPCHAGLIEVITPVQIDGAVVGFLLLSHIVQGADEQSEWSYAQKCCSAYAIDKTALQKAAHALSGAEISSGSAGFGGGCIVPKGTDAAGSGQCAGKTEPLPGETSG